MSSWKNCAIKNNWPFRIDVTCTFTLQSAERMFSLTFCAHHCATFDLNLRWRNLLNCPQTHVAIASQKIPDIPTRNERCKTAYGRCCRLCRQCTYLSFHKNVCNVGRGAFFVEVKILYQFFACNFGAILHNFLDNLSFIQRCKFNANLIQRSFEGQRLHFLLPEVKICAFFSAWGERFCIYLCILSLGGPPFFEIGPWSIRSKRPTYKLGLGEPPPPRYNLMSWLTLLWSNICLLQ
jgi:hypothetical protein